MRRFMLLATGACFALIASGCDTSLPAENPYDPDIPAHEREPGSLAGRLVAELDVDLEQAVVRVQTAGRVVVPDGQGNFEIPDLIPGVHELRIEAPRHSVWRQAGLYVDTGTRVDLGEIRLAAARGALSGAVKLEKIPGVPLDTHGGVLVTALPAAGEGRLAAGETGKSVSSNPDGSWSLDGLVVGDYQVQGTHEEFFNWDTLTVSVTEDEVTPVSEIVLRSISGVIAIDEGAEYTRSAEVTLRVLAFEADEMKISSDADLTGAEWQIFQVDNPWTLSGGDGEAVVYARFRNSEGFITPVVSDSIVLDREAPSDTRVRIADDATYVQDRQVALSLAAEDALSGVTGMRIALDGDVTDEAWVDFAAQHVVELPLDAGETPDGLQREVLAQFRDGAGNESVAASDTVILDSVAPGDPAIVIAGGAALTASRNVTLSLQAAGATRMQVSNDSGLAGAEWLPYSPSLGWVLTEGEEQKTVFARFSDEAGNQTAIVEDGIELNTRGRVSANFQLEGAGADQHAGITVALDTEPVSSAVTNAAGQVSFGGVTVGIYTLTASLAGYRPVEVRGVEVQPGEDTFVGPYTLDVATGAIAGSVTLAGATDHSGITVEVDNTDLAGVTIATGRFRIDSLAVGDYTLTARKDGYVPQGLGLVTVEDGRTVEVAPAQLVRQTGDFVIEDAEGDQAYVNHRAVTLRFVEVPPGAVEIRALESADLSGAAWEAFTGASHGFQLADEDGTRTVFAQFRDAAQVESPVFSSSTVLDRAAPLDTSKVAIDEGALYSTSPDGDVALTLAGHDATSGVARMRISVDGVLDDEAEQGYTTSMAPVRLDDPQADGEKTVWVEFIDRAGNRSAAPSSDTIYLDRAAPTSPAIDINGGATYTTETLVTLALSADEACDAGYPGGDCPARVVSPAQMMLSNDAGFPGAAWEAFAETRAWFLPPGDGLKTVHVRFRDGAGNATDSIPAEIRLDRAPPGSPSIAIVGGEYTATRTVDLSLSATGGAVEMAVWEPADFGAGADTFVPYVTSLDDFELTDGDGLKSVAAVFRDAAGNVSEVASDTVVLDTRPPSGSVSIAEGEYTLDTTVTLEIQSPDADGICVVIGGDPGPTDCDEETEWQGFAATVPVALPDVEGRHTISVVLRDTAGNVADPLKAEITLDTKAPDDGLVEVTGTIYQLDGSPQSSAVLTALTEVRLRLESSDSGSGVAEVLISNDAAFSGAVWRPYSGPVMVLDGWSLGTAAGDGTDRTVYVRYRDHAGRESDAAVSDTIVLDNVAPSSGSVVIDGGLEFTIDARVDLALSAIGAAYAQYDVDPGFPGGLWKAAPWSGDTVDLPAIEGMRQVYAKFRDDAGNESAVASDGIYYDLAAPQAPTLLHTPGRLVGGSYHTASLTPTLSWTASISGDVEGYVVEVDGLPYPTPSISFVAPALSEDVHSWSVRAVDRAGRESADVPGFDFTVDVTPPTAPRFEDVAQSMVGLIDPNRFPEAGTLDLAVASTDANLHGYEIRGGHDGAGTPLDDWVHQGLGTSFVYYLLADQWNTLMVRAVDKAGNSSDADFVNLLEDSTAPLPPLSIEVSQGQGEVQVRWQPSPSDDVVGYNLYYGTTPGLPNGSFADQGASPVYAGDVRQAGLTGMPNGTPIYISLTAIDRIEQESIRTLEVLTVPNVVTPEVAGVLGGTARELTLAGNLGLLATGLGLRLLDVNNPTDLRTLSSLALPGGAFQAVPYFTGGRDYAIVAGGEAGLQVVDITDTANPFRVSAAPVRVSAVEILMVGGHAFVRDELAGVAVFDLADPIDPQEVATYFYTAGEGDGPMAYESPALYAGNVILDVSSPDQPTAAAAVGLGSGAKVVMGGELFAMLDDSLQRWDLADPLAPSLVDEVQLVANGEPVDLMAYGPYLLASRGAYGIKVFEISPDLWPVGMMTAPGYVEALAGDAARPFLVDRTAGLLPLDLSSPECFVDLFGRSLGDYMRLEVEPGQGTLSVLQDDDSLAIYSLTDLTQTAVHADWTGGGPVALDVTPGCIVGSSANNLVAAPHADPSAANSIAASGGLPGWTDITVFDEPGMIIAVVGLDTQIGWATADPTGCGWTSSLEYVQGNPIPNISCSGPLSVYSGAWSPTMDKGYMVGANTRMHCGWHRVFEFDPYGFPPSASYTASTFGGDPVVDLQVFSWPGSGPTDLAVVLANFGGYEIRMIDHMGHTDFVMDSNSDTEGTVTSVHANYADDVIYVGGEDFVEIRTLSSGALQYRAQTFQADAVRRAGSNLLVATREFESPSVGLGMIYGGAFTAGPALGGAGQPFDFYSQAIEDGGLLYLLDALKGLRIFDASDPAAVVELGSLDLGDTHRALSVAGPWAAVVADKALFLVDVSDPTAPTVSDQRGHGGFVHAEDVRVHGGWIYIPMGNAWGTLGYRIKSDGTLGTNEHTTDYARLDDNGGMPTGVATFGDRLLEAQDDGSVNMWDIADPPSAAVVGSEMITQMVSEEGRPESALIDPRAWCVSAGRSGFACGPWDPVSGAITDPPDRRETTAEVLDGVLVGAEVVAAEAGRGLRVWDAAQVDASGLITDEVGFLDTAGRAMSIALSGPYAYLSDGEGGVLVLELADVVRPRRRAGSSACSSSLALDGAALYSLGCQELAYTKLYSMDITSATGSAPFPHNGPTGLAVRQGYAYVGDGINALHSVALADLSVLNTCAACTAQAGPLVRWGEYVITVAGGDTLEMVDATDPGALALVDNLLLAVSAEINGIGLAGSRVAVVNDQMGIELFDARRDGLYRRGRLALAGIAGAVDLSWSHAYVAAGWAGLTVVDTTDPDSPVVVGQADTPGFAQAVDVHGRYAFVAQGTGVTIFDLIDPAAPTPVSTYDAGATVWDVKAHGTAAYLALEGAGTVVVDLR